MDETVWHKCHFPWWPIKRDESGRLFLIAHNGQLWRRRVNGGWQYRQDDQTFDDWDRSII